MSPPVLQLQVHLPSMHMILMNDTDNLEDVAVHARSQQSMLTEYFRMNAIDPDACQYLCKEFPKHYTWKRSGRYWHARV